MVAAFFMQHGRVGHLLQILKNPRTVAAHHVAALDRQLHGNEVRHVSTRVSTRTRRDACAKPRGHGTWPPHETNRFIVCGHYLGALQALDGVGRQRFHAQTMTAARTQTCKEPYLHASRRVALLHVHFGDAGLTLGYMLGRQLDLHGPPPNGEVFLERLLVALQ